jgi:hypothetical protein
MENSYLFFVAIDIGCFLLLALLFSGVSGKNEMSFGESAIFYLVSFCIAASAMLLWLYYSL